MNPGKLFVVSACSGAGKTTLVRASLDNLRLHGFSIARVTTYTTKKRRSGEVDGRDYYFITEKEFEEKIEKDFFIEWSKAYGAYYGSPRHVVEEVQKGGTRFLILDRAGAREVLRQESEAVLIWIYAANLQVLRERLEKRAEDSVNQIEKRLKIAASEIMEEKVDSFYHYHILNDRFDDAVKELNSIVIKELHLESQTF